MAVKSNSKSAGNDQVMTAFDFLDRAEAAPLPAVVASFGPDDFLRRRVLHHAIAVGGLDESTLRTFEGDEAQWRDVHDELATRSLFDTEGKRGAKLRNADGFVSKNRDALERWIERPAEGSTLLLDLRTLPATTNLYKGIKKRGWLISTTEPKDAELTEWILRWAKNHHSLYLSRPQANVLVDRIGPVCGLIDCELAKLALFADHQGAVSDARVEELVGGWRTQTVWNLADAIAEGKIEEALRNIDKLIMAGQSIFGIAAQLSWSMRRYGTAARIVEQMERAGQRPVLQQALERAGFRPYELAKAEHRLRRIGRARARELLSWLLELELQLKGSHSQEDRGRLALETFLFRLADLGTPSAAASSTRNAR
jgi:DNA polymerase-3 subunit delta